MGDAVIFPEDPENVGAIRNFLEMNINPITRQSWWKGTVVVESKRAGFTAFFYVRQLRVAVVHQLLEPQMANLLLVRPLGPPGPLTHR